MKMFIKKNALDPAKCWKAKTYNEDDALAIHAHTKVFLTR